MSQLSVLGWRLKLALRKRGLLWVLRAVVYKMATMGARRRNAQHEREFDERYGVDTAGIVSLPALDIRSANRDLGVRYQATSPDTFRRLMRSLPIDHDRFVFIDLGCGKGRALLLASEFPFSRIIGVDFSAELLRVARQNIARFSSDHQRCRSFELVHADAADYDIPHAPVVLFFYSPFADLVMRRVMARVRRALDEAPREAFVILAGDGLLAPAVEDAGFVRSVDDSLAEEAALGPGVFAAVCQRD